MQRTTGSVKVLLGLMSTPYYYDVVQNWAHKFQNLRATLSKWAQRDLSRMSTGTQDLCPKETLLRRMHTP